LCDFLNASFAHFPSSAITAPISRAGLPAVAERQWAIVGRPELRRRLLGTVKAKSSCYQLPHHHSARRAPAADPRLPAPRTLQLQAIPLPMRHGRIELLADTRHRRMRMRPRAAPPRNHANLRRRLLPLQHAYALVVTPLLRPRQSTLQTLCATWRPSLAGRWPAPGGMRSPVPGLFLRCSVVLAGGFPAHHRLRAPAACVPARSAPLSGGRWY
jgi:hypothetical protein